MNLKELRKKISNISDYKPTNPEAISDLNDIINSAYNWIWLAAPWSFAQRLVELPVQPDLSYAATSVTAVLSNYSRKIAFSGPIYALTDFIYAGQIFEVSGREYKILEVISNQEIRLSEPYRGDDDPASTGWHLKVKWYEMPQDLVQIYSLSHRDAPVNGGRRQQVKGLASKTEESLALSEDRTGAVAEWYVNIPPTYIPSGEVLSQVTPSGGGTVGDLSTSSFYEFAWAFRKGDSYGPLSDPLTVQPILREGTAHPSIWLSPTTWDGITVVTPGFNPIFDKELNVWEGYSKVLFTNVNISHSTGERLGPPKFVAVTTFSGSQSQYDGTLYGLSDIEDTWKIWWKESLSPGNPIYGEIDGHYHLIRFYPRISSYDFLNAYKESPDGSGGTIKAPQEYFKRLELRYSFKPIPLALETDVPLMPFDLHELIVFKALIDYYNKKGALELANLYSLRLEKELVGAKSKYIERSDVTHQRSLQWGSGRYPMTIPTRITRTSF